MRDPHVRFCERRGGVISRAYSTRRGAVWTAASTARRLIRSGMPPRHCPFRRMLVAAVNGGEKFPRIVGQKFPTLF